MSRLFDILDGIISDKEFCDQNLSDPSVVQDYAEYAGEQISIAEAERICETGKKWLRDQGNGNGEWSRMREEAKAALSDD